MEIYEILPGKLFQSPTIEGEFEEILQKRINVIIDMEGSEDMVDERIVSYLYWPIQDAEAPSRDQLDMVALFGVNAIRAGLVVLSHCGEGINRSSLVNARILMLLEGISADEAIDKIRKVRPEALQNPNFVAMLKSF